MGSRRSGPSQLMRLSEVLEDGSHSVGHWAHGRGKPRVFHVCFRKLSAVCNVNWPGGEGEEVQSAGGP